MEKVLGNIKAEEKSTVGNDGNNESKKKAQMPGLSGNIYQSKLLMWYLVRGLSSDRYKFELGTEIEEAGKYDDMVFKYSENEKDRFVIVQSKHKTGTNPNIKYEDILTSGNVDFGLVKYYNSFIDSKKEKMFRDGEIEYAVIYTNARLDMKGKIPEKDDNWKQLQNIENIIEEMNMEQDSVLNLCKIDGGKYYQFKSELVFPVLKSMLSDYYSDYNHIAQKLIKCLKSMRNYLATDDGILKKYDCLLMTEVINDEDNTLQKEFIGEVGNVTGRQKLRNALNEVALVEKIDLNQILNNKIKLQKNFGKSGNTSQSWPADIKDDDVKEFLKKCVFATRQPDEKKLGNIILAELKQQYSTYDGNLIYANFHKEILDWMKGEKFDNDESKPTYDRESRFISFKDAKDFFRNMIRKFNEIMLKGPTIDYDSHIQKYNIDFVEMELENTVKTFLFSEKRILSIVSEHILISSIKLYKKLTKEKNIIYLRLSLSNEFTLNSAIEAFQSDNTDHLLVIEWDLDESNIDEYMDGINNIIDAIRSNDEKKLIVVSNQNNTLENYFSNDFSEEECENIIDSTNLLENLQKYSQDSFLNTKVNFQGNSNVKLDDLINSDDLKKMIDGEILQKILKNEDITISKQIEGLKDVKDYYINRTFIFEVKNDKNVYLLSKMSEKDICAENLDLEVIKENRNLKKSTDINESDVFERAAEENDRKDIYLLRKKSDNELVLLRKTNNSFDDTDFQNSMNCKKDKFKMNLMAAIAGTGKSTLFTNLSKEIKDRNPTMWVIKIDLNSIASELKKIENSDVQFETAIKILHHSSNHESELEKRILEHHLKKMNVEIFLDGFDEICPDYKRTVLKIIDELEKGAKIKKIWVSTRPYDSIIKDMEESFKDYYSMYCYIEPFTEDNQKYYLEHFWKRSIEPFNEEFFKSFVTELFELLNNNIDDRRREFLGIALHTMMVAATFEDTYKEFQNSGTSAIKEEQRQKLLEMLNLSKLYEKFVEFKFKIQCNEKGLLNLDTVTAKNIAKIQFEEHVKKIKILALNSLFNDTILKIFLTQEEAKHLNTYKDEIVEGGDGIGIVSRIVERIPQFIHRTFAEYFVAMFFVENLIKDEEQSRTIAEYYLKNMIIQDNTVICYFVESMLNYKPLEYNNKYEKLIKKMDGRQLFFVLENKWQNIARILICNQIDVNYQNTTNKTVFHLASEHENSVLNLLFEKFNDKKKLEYELLKKEKLHGDMPLFTAVLHGRLENIVTILKKCDEMGIDNILMETNERGENILHKEAMREHNDNSSIYVLDLLNSKHDVFKKCLHEQDNEGYTPLDKAARFGNFTKFKTIREMLEKSNIATDSILMNVNKYGENIIHLAVGSECDDDFLYYVLNLLKSKPESLEKLLHKKNNEGYMPLDKVARFGYINRFEAIWKVLEELKISTENILMNENKYGANIIHLAVGSECDENFLNYVLKLLKNNPDALKKLLHKKDNEGYTPFDDAARCGYFIRFEAMWKVLEELKISTEKILMNENNKGLNIIHLAVGSECNENFLNDVLNHLKNRDGVLEKLLNKKNCNGYTPFDYAARYGYFTRSKPIWKVLEELKISTNKILMNENKHGANIIHLAVGPKCDNDFFNYVLNLSTSQSEFLEKLLHKKDNEGYTPFDEAARCGNFTRFKTMLEVLKESHISTDNILMNDNKYGANIIHLALGPKCDDDFFNYVLNILKSKPEFLEKLLRKKDNEGETPFDVAARCGNFTRFNTILKVLEESHISTDNILVNENDKGENIIHLAVGPKSDEVFLNYILNLLKSKSEFLEKLLHKKDNEGYTPLCKTARFGYINRFKAIWEVLEESKVSTDEILINENKHGANMIHLAVELKCNDDFLNIMLDLLKSKPDVLEKLLHKTDKEGYTPFDYATRYGYFIRFKALWDVLEEFKISTENILMNNKNEHGDNIIHLAVGSECNNDFLNDMLKLLKNNPEALKKLLHKKDNEGYTPFDDAARCGYFTKFKSMWEALEESQISTDDILMNVNNKGENIIHLAAGPKCNEEFLNDMLGLIKSKPNILKDLLHKKDGFGHTPFDEAARYGNFTKFKTMWDVLEELQISTDSILMNENKYGENMIHQAVGSESNDDFLNKVLIFLKDKSGYLELLLHKKDNEGYTPFDEAARCRNFTSFKTMLIVLEDSHFSTDNILMKENNQGENIIHLALGPKCNEDFLKYVLGLVKNKSGVLEKLLDKKNSNGYTPYDKATKHGYFDKFTAILNQFI